MVRETRHLIEVTDELRAVLLSYRKGCEGMLRSGAPGQPAADTIQSIERLKVREHRDAVKEALETFEAARHRLRVELVAAAQDEGRNLSDVARAMGVSRQLTSRLGMEARDGRRKG